MQVTADQLKVCFPAELAEWNEDEFFRFCSANRELRIERSAEGDITVMPPAGGYAGFQSGKVFSQLDVWSSRDGTGIAFDSSTGFRLPNGAMRSPDAAWVRLSRLQNLTHQEKEQFIPLCPDFVIEVKSPSDKVSTLRDKMNEYVACGLRLGLSLLPDLKQVEIYTTGAVQVIQEPAIITGDPVLPGFKLDLTLIWKPPF